MKAKKSLSSPLSGRDDLLLCLPSISLNRASASPTTSTDTISQCAWGGGDSAHTINQSIVKYSQVINICLKLLIPPSDPVYLRITHSHLSAECARDFHTTKLSWGGHS